MGSERRSRITPDAFELGMSIALRRDIEGAKIMSLVRLLGFTTLACGCVVGHYREKGTDRDLAYIEEKGGACDAVHHRRNHTVAAARLQVSLSLLNAKAS
jgi:hypothetical protein